MQETGPAPSSPKTPVYGYATTAAREAGFFNEELREQAEVIEANAIGSASHCSKSSASASPTTARDSGDRVWNTR